MGFRFEPGDQSVERGVRRIAAEEVAGALAALDDDARPLPERIHEARKAVKKLRGLIRLVRPAFADFSTENAALRNAGRRISGLRETEVAARTLAALAGEAALSETERAALDAPFRARHEAEHGALEEAVAGFRRAITALAGRAEGWRVKGREFDAIEPGLAATWTAAGTTMKHALRRGRDDDFHNWRKRAKDHWYQTRLLAPIWPEAMAPHVTAADRLGEALGEYNDLSVLICDIARGDAGGAGRARLVEEAGRRREALLEEAALLGRRLFAGPPEALTARWRVWWTLWRV